MRRILMDPAADAAGGAPVTPAASTAPVPPPAATPAPSASVAAPPAAPAPPPTVPLTVEEYQRLRDAERSLAEIQAKQQEAIEAKEREKLKALADKEGAEKALAAQEEQWRGKYAEKDRDLSALKQRYHGEKKLNAINDALGGVRFLSDEAARDARAKLAERLDTAEDSAGSISVRCKSTGRPHGEVIKEWLGSPDFAHFLETSSRGGGGASAGGRATPTPSPANVPDAAAVWADRIKQAVALRTAGAPGLAGNYSGLSSHSN